MAETAVMAPSAGGAAPAAQLARVWLTALTVSGDERPADPDGIPMDIASARAFLTAQSAALFAIVLGRPVPAAAGRCRRACAGEGGLRERRRPRPVAAGADHAAPRTAPPAARSPGHPP